MEGEGKASDKEGKRKGKGRREIKLKIGGWGKKSFRLVAIL